MLLLLATTCALAAEPDAPAEPTPPEQLSPAEAFFRILRTPGASSSDRHAAWRELLDSGIIPESQAKRYVIRARFWELYKANPSRSARDVELELSVVYEVPIRTIQF
ncbi:MAG TPA: hypothetical protein PLF80_12175 [Flavobacteriales bacterium]|nr:hypothetical protein [Flavobacteriales bacterium]